MESPFRSQPPFSPIPESLDSVTAGPDLTVNALDRRVAVKDGSAFVRAQHMAGIRIGDAVLEAIQRATLFVQRLWSESPLGPNKSDSAIHGLISTELARYLPPDWEMMVVPTVRLHSDGNANYVRFKIPRYLWAELHDASNIGELYFAISAPKGNTLASMGRTGRDFTLKLLLCPEALAEMAGGGILSMREIVTHELSHIRHYDEKGDLMSGTPLYLFTRIELVAFAAAFGVVACELGQRDENRIDLQSLYESPRCYLMSRHLRKLVSRGFIENLTIRKKPGTYWLRCVERLAALHRTAHRQALEALAAQR